jgi:hypothetical protein
VDEFADGFSPGGAVFGLEVGGGKAEGLDGAAGVMALEAVNTTKIPGKLR